MRYAELVFLLVLTAYQAVLLLPRHRRPFATNYLVFLAGMALAWNLGLEGLRWQTIPPVVLLLVDLAILFPTFATLRGRVPGKGFLPATAGVLRTLAASVGVFLAVGSGLLAVAFPLPAVGLTGGLLPSQRVVRFPPQGDLPGLELKLWYPAAGDERPLPRPVSEPESWRRLEVRSGLPAFWLSYQGALPTNLVRGGKLATPGNSYPVVYVALPAGQNADDFGYLFEDLASRGFVVAAGAPLSEAPPGPVAFSWDQVVRDLGRPFAEPGLWLEPDRTLALEAQPTDYTWLEATRQAVAQLNGEPGDLLYSSVDLKHQVLWAWGPGPALGPAALDFLGLKGQIHVGGSPGSGNPASEPELWILGAPAGKPAQPAQWFLEVPQLNRADLADSAYLRPYLALFGVKSQADAGVHGALRQYQAAFFQYSLWGAGGDTAFGQTVPEVPGLRLLGP